jgi:phage-Barnase-EndoU-ColicinE5/D-RelE like nuclease3
LIPDILAAPDSVTGTGKSRIGAETITYQKEIGETLFYVEEIRTGRRELAMKTMFKR